MEKSNTVLPLYFCVLILTNVEIYATNCGTSSSKYNGYLGETDVSDYNDGVDSTIGQSYLILADDTEYTFRCCGRIEQWRYRAGNVGDVYLQVWRNTGSTWELVGQNYSNESTSVGQIITHPVSTNQQIVVKSGDVLGWYSPNLPVISYEAGYSENHEDDWYLTTAITPTTTTFDWLNSATRYDSRDFAIRADMTTPNNPSFTNLDATLSLTNTDSLSFTLTATDADTTDTLTYSMTSETGFSFDPSTATVTNTSAMTAGTYVFNFQVADSCDNTDSGTLTLTVTNSPPVINNLPANTSVREDQQTELHLYDIDVTDTSGEIVTCSIPSVNPASTDFIIKIDAVTNVNSIYVAANPSFNYDTYSQYDLTISCTDNTTPVTGTYTVYIIPNEAPVITNLAATISMAKACNTNGLNIFNVTATDAENDNLHYNMTCTPSGCPFSISSAGVISSTADLTGHAQSSYDLNVYVYDAYNAVGPRTLTVTLTAYSPTFTNLDATQTLADTDSLSFTATATHPEATETLTYSMTSKTGFSFDVSSATLTNAGIMASGTHTFNFQVTDSCGNTDTGVLTLTVTNTPPVINGLPSNSSVREDQQTELHLYDIDVTDASGENITCSIPSVIPASSDFIIKIDSGTNTNSIYVAAGPTFNYDVTSQYDLTIGCTDQTTSVTGTYTVYIIPNEAPVITNLAATVVIASACTATGDDIFTVTSTDVENDPLHFNMTCTPSGCPFTISNSGLIESASDLTGHSQPSYGLDVYVYDGYSLVGPSTLTVTLTANNPTFTNLDANLNLTNADSLSFTATATDADVNDTLTYSMTSMSGFSFDSSTATVTNTGKMSVGTHIFNFQVTDSCGSSDTGTLTLYITNVPPEMNNLPANTEVREDQLAELHLYDINVTDASGETVTCSVQSVSPVSNDFFIRVGSGATANSIYVKAGPSFDYGTTRRYDLIINCTDQITAVTGTYTVFILPNEEPVITNLAATTQVSTSSTAMGDDVYTVTSTDAENDQLHYNMTCNPPGCPFTIFDSGLIEATIDLTGHSQAGYDIYVYVYDGYTLVGPRTLTVTLTDHNSIPVITNLPLSAALSLPENTAIGTSVFQTRVTDPNLGDTHSYIASYNPTSGSSLFQTDTSSGLVSTVSSIDYEGLSVRSYTITITVNDGQDSDTESLQISIIDVNEAPVFAYQQYTLTGNEGQAGDVIGTPAYGVTDEDSGDTHTYSIDCASLNIDQTTGQISLAIDYDIDILGTSDTITCNVTASDGALTDVATLIVTILNINDNTPTFPFSSYTFYCDSGNGVGTSLGTASATDGDIGTYGDITYSLDQSSLSMEYFEVTDTTGEIYIKNDLDFTYNRTDYVFQINATDTGGLGALANITVTCQGYSTLPPINVTERYITFFEDPRNLPWFVISMIILGFIAAFLIFLFITAGCCNVCKRVDNYWKRKKWELRRKDREQTKEKHNYNNRTDSPVSLISSSHSSASVSPDRSPKPSSGMWDPWTNSSDFAK